MTSPPRRGGFITAGPVTAVVATAAAVLVLALWFGGAGPRPAIEGLPSPGVLTTWGLPVARLVLDVCAAATVGVLLASVVLVPTGSSGTGRADAGAADAGTTRSLARAAAAWAAGWALSAMVTEVLTLSDFLGLPAGQAMRSGALTVFLLNIPQGQAFAVVAAAAVALAAGSLLPWGRAWRAVLLAVAILAVLPPAYVGHSASAADHNLAVLSLMAHVAAVVLWTGGLYALVAHLRAAPGLAVAVGRFSTLALGCFAAAAASGALNAWVRLGALPPLWQSRYGLLVLAKIAALAALGWFGWRHRRATIEALRTGVSRAPFVRLAAGEITVMAGTLALAVALGRSAPPAGEAEHQHDALGYALPPFTPGALATDVRPDPIALLLLAAAAAAYLAGVRRLRADGAGWPAGRTVSWLAGLLVLAYATSGGVAAYAPALFSAHAAQYALLGAVGPVLLAAGAPLTLWRRAHPGPDALDGPAARTLSHPMVALALYALPYPALYLTGLFAFAQPSLALRLAAQTIVIVTGVLFFVVAAGVDPLPWAIRPQVRAWMLATAIAVRIWTGLAVLTGPGQAPQWYAALGLPWAPDPAADQRTGALLGTGLSVAVLAALLVLLLGRWRAALRRTAARDATGERGERAASPTGG
ncbi:cytochrome c oxidase assembly protein [Microbispora sp. H10885]|uniref:cytochrome c oxidase assembly protein n=1 Tax=Microbispora sp. H10885 TaxID=2729110 RepID=UPI0016038204|nr:cytochrome c oxidase assembly protein [Microbispora sp. H10885]